MSFDYKNHIMFLTLAGSRVYGTNNDNSDYDYRGIILPPKQLYFSPSFTFEQKEGLDGYGDDSVAYEIKKFISLAKNNNPNVLEQLFIDDKFSVVNTEKSRLLRDKKSWFLSKKLRHTFGGYAHTQFYKMKKHVGFSKTPVQQKSRADFGLPQSPLFSQPTLAKFEQFPSELVNPEYREYVKSELDWAAHQKEYKSFLDWNRNRNGVRLELEKAFGYDTKHAMHVVRLVLTCRDALKYGDLIVTRPEAEMLKDVRNGLWSLEKVDEFFQEGMAELDSLMEKTSLPDLPKSEEIDSLCEFLIGE